MNTISGDLFNSSSLLNSLVSASPVKALASVTNTISQSTSTKSPDLVTISDLGQVLSSSLSRFQSSLQALYTPGNNLTTRTQFATQAQSLVDTFNDFSNSLNKLNSADGQQAAAPITGALIQALHQALNHSSSNGRSLLTQLKPIGLNYQAPTQDGQLGSLSINENVLQSAFSKDATNTTSLIRIAAQSLKNTLNNSATYNNSTTEKPNSLQKTSPSNRTLLDSASNTNSHLRTNVDSTISAPKHSAPLSSQHIAALSLYTDVYSISVPYVGNELIIDAGPGLSISGNNIST